MLKDKNTDNENTDHGPDVTREGPDWDHLRCGFSLAGRQCYLLGTSSPATQGKEAKYGAKTAPAAKFFCDFHSQVISGGGVRHDRESFSHWVKSERAWVDLHSPHNNPPEVYWPEEDLWKAADGRVWLPKMDHDPRDPPSPRMSPQQFQQLRSRIMGLTKQMTKGVRPTEPEAPGRF